MEWLSLTLLGSQWKRAADELGIEIVVPFKLKTPDGAAYEFACLLPQFGGPNGTLLHTSHDKAAVDAAYAAGFAVSEMYAETRLEFDLASYIDCLCDWEWNMAMKAPPAWYSPNPLAAS